MAFYAYTQPNSDQAPRGEGLKKHGTADVVASDPRAWLDRWYLFLSPLSIFFNGLALFFMLGLNR